MTPQPVTIARIAEWFDANELNYDATDEAIQTGFPGLAVFIVTDGEDDIWLRVIGHWMGTIPPSEIDAVAAFVADWNANKVIPKVHFGENVYDDVPEVTISGDVVGLIENGYTDEQLSGFLNMALSSLNFMADAVAEAFAAYAPNDDEDN